ncbi:O-antigen ligase [Mycobacterium sp. 155]|uniref:O-antigen ligase family protein n=1 Tax=Mycobacterium sp. 155 TaxID=1157943 RepID=UPI00039A60A4|nr:O-antigen ligase family protein [Mycobacterium sp. 155]
MTAVGRSLTGRGAAIGLIGAGLAVVSLAVLGPKPMIIAVGLPAAIAAALYAARRPQVMLVAMVVIEVTNLAGVVATHSSVPVFHASLGLGLLTVVLALRDPQMRGRLNRGTVICAGLIACYLATQLLATFKSLDADRSMAMMTHYVMDCVFLFVLLVLAQLSGKPWAVAAAVVVPLAVLSVLTLINQVVFGGTQPFGGFANVTEQSGELVTTLRYGGPLYDPNFWGRHLILGLPLAGALIVRAVQSGRRMAVLGWSVSMLALLAGVYLTQSRGTFLATAMVFLVWAVASGPVARRRALMAVPLVALVFLVPGIGDRLSALVADVSDSGQQYGLDTSVHDRTAAQEMAWDMFRDRPVFGLGPDLFAPSVPKYAGFVNTAVLDFERGPTAAHNLYLQLAAESGIVGLLGWLIFVGGFIGYIAFRVTRLSAVRNLADRSLAAATLAALIGWSVASVFLHLSYFRTFAVLLALAGSLASTTTDDCGASPDWRRRLSALTLGVFLGAATTATVVYASSTEVHTASQSVTLLPSGKIGWRYAYALDVRSREVLLPTYAVIAGFDMPGIKTFADTVRGLITVSATDADSDRARASLDRALANGSERWAGLDTQSAYRIVPVDSVKETTSTNRSTRWTAIGVIAGVIVAAVTAQSLRRRSTDSLDSHAGSAVSDHAIN